MGLLDDLLGGALGTPQTNTPAQQSEGGGMSPVMLALMALMAYRALKGGAAPAPRDANTAQAASDNPLGDLLGSILAGGQMGGPAAGSRGGGGLGGGLGDILGGVLGGGAQRDPVAPGGRSGGGTSGGGTLGDLLGSILAGGAAGGALGGGLGNVLNGGLDDILKQMREHGNGDIADSWVGRGQNKQIGPRELEDALGPETTKSLAEQAGLSHVQFMQGLAQGLPQVVDRMTPDGRLPTREEAARWF